ncbi:MAG: hypothetical protein QM759_09305 [Terricaulis sp.]
MTVLPVILYALIALPLGHDAMSNSLDAPLFAIRLPSNVEWVVRWADALIMFAAGCLFIEIIKATSTRRSVLIENGLAVLCFTLALIAFLLVPAFGTNEFFLIMSMILVDFIASFIVMTVSARRDVSFSN